jgi:E3 ubiquitin-protein ligase SHPRH
VENPDNEFYAEALKAQGDVEAYLIAYAAAVADRRGQSHDMGGAWHAG